MIVLSIYAIIVTVAFLIAINESKDAKAESKSLRDRVLVVRSLHERESEHYEKLLDGKDSVIRALENKKSPIPIKAPVVESNPKPEDWQAELSRLLKEEDESLQKE